MAIKRNKVFPQANNISVLIKTLKLIEKNKRISREALAKNLTLVSRQVEYYLNALYYFDLITENAGLTLKGEFIVTAENATDQARIFKNIIIQEEIFKDIDAYISINKKLPETTLIANNISKYYIYSESTLHRRASTVKSWFNYFVEINLYGENLNEKLL
jgi:hypothetical protein